MDLVPMVQPIFNVGTTQKVTVSNTHAETTNTVNANAILICSTTDCHVVIADAPVATANDFFIPKGIFVAIACVPTNKVSAIQDSAGGSLFVTSLN